MLEISSTSQLCFDLFFHHIVSGIFQWTAECSLFLIFLGRIAPGWNPDWKKRGNVWAPSVRAWSRWFDCQTAACRLLIFSISSVKLRSSPILGHLRISLWVVHVTGVGKSRFIVVSTWNAEFILVLFINYCITYLHYNCIPTFAHHCIWFVMGNKLLVMSNLRSFQKCFLLYAIFALHAKFSD